ncbi:hypothetical protein CCM_01440 [Cordyceps militaris CM01]|uniref:Uncharacterized protein n=1 Tax=Cordyceps militaris (strain CM01) TaxID=983644 RepID=G3J519_CORMM|nr:uncharacterized protein CCM_01440 [Cordyceps militaris CM01]EGX96782.1 hypothetical protein CCM_01440 [Cordyceps militaris CM01]
MYNNAHTLPLVYTQTKPIRQRISLPSAHHSEQSIQPDQRAREHEHVHQVVTLAEQVKRPRKPALRNPRRVQRRAGEVDKRQAEKRLETHHVLQRREAEPGPAMQSRRKEARSQEAIQEKAHRAIGRLPKRGTQSKDAAANGRAAEGEMVQHLQSWLAVKGEMHARDSGSPHDENDAQVVELVAEPMHAGAVVRECVKRGGQHEADHHGEVVHADGRNVGGTRAILAGKGAQMKKVDQPYEELGSTDEMGPDIGCRLGQSTCRRDACFSAEDTDLSHCAPPKYS